MDCVAHLERAQSGLVLPARGRAPVIKHSPRVHLAVTIIPPVNAPVESGSGNLKGQHRFLMYVCLHCDLFFYDNKFVL